MGNDKTKMKVEQKLKYPESDFREEYTGKVKDGYIPHGQGTLKVKNSEEIFTGRWTDGVFEEKSEEIERLEKTWKEQNKEQDKEGKTE